MIHRSIVVAGLALAVVSLSGCRSNHLYFSTHTKFGVDVSAVNGVPSSAMLGYKRFEGAIVPVIPPDKDGNTDPAAGNGAPEAASVLAVIDMNNKWLGGLDLFQLFATGEAAVAASRDDTDGLADILEAMRVKVAVEAEKEAAK
jgi:hypothetical protein